jgi:hypothetical protein
MGGKVPGLEKAYPELRVTEHLLILGLRKQRMADSGQIIPLYVDWERNEIFPMETRAWG